MLKIFNITKNETEQIQGLETWVVSWKKRVGIYPFDKIEVCYQAFVDKNEAKKFKISLKNAFELIGTTTDSGVELKKQEVGL